jgi:hypothetical protein
MNGVYNTSINSSGLTCHKCGRVGMTSATFVNGLCACDWCLPNSPINSNIKISELYQRIELLEKQVAYLDRKLKYG